VTQSGLLESLERSLANSGQTADANSSISVRQRPRALKALVAEDVPTNQKIVSEMLALLGIEVVITSNGVEALQEFKSRSFDIVFMDCQMPIMDGFSATRKIREYELEHTLQRTPIIALSAGTSGEAEDEAIRNGMDSYIPKPFSAKDLQVALETFLENDSRTDTFPSSENSEREDSESATDFYSDSGIDVLNEAAISSILEVEEKTGGTLFDELLDGYRSQVLEKIRELADCADRSDAEEARTISHAIKSMSANLGAEAVRSVAAEIEEEARLGSLSAIRERLDELPRLVEEYLEAISRHRHSHHAKSEVRIN
jgi:CheY-like chemotaxis protein/HPt (histidine-containing phosphotransfer) domain-containing protein